MTVTDTVLVRIHPYSPRRGFVLRRYVYADPKTGTRYRFDESRGWYTVPKRIGDYLKTIHSRIEDPESPFAFDVETREKATRIDAAEQVEEEPRATANRARSATEAQPAAVDAKEVPRDTEETKPEAAEDGSDPDPLEMDGTSSRRRGRRRSE